MMIKKIYLLLLAAMAVASCTHDEVADTVYVNPIDLHLTYEIFGDSEAFVSPLTVQMNNLTEQFSQEFETDLWGRISLDALLPGEYVISVRGKLTPEQVEQITGEEVADGYNLSGYVSSAKLSLNRDYDLPIEILGQKPSTLIFKELYYAGSKTVSGGTYRNDCFFSICNNSEEPISLDDIYIANADMYGGIGETGPLWGGEEAGNYKNVYAQVMWKIIANGEPDRVLEPGESAVIATMAAPHNKLTTLNPNSPVDLSGADYEAYIVDPTNTYVDYDAPNMELAFWPDYAYLWRLSVFGQGMMLVKASPEEFKTFDTVALPEVFWDGFESEQYWLCKRIPNSFVIDAVDLIQNEQVTNTKRFHHSLDSGYATVGATYSGCSVLRKVSGERDGVVYYQDTNNSAQDFVVNESPLAY